MKTRYLNDVSMVWFSNIVLVLPFIAFILIENVSGQEDRVKLSEIESISLSKDKLTAARRSSPIDQLKCVGSYYKCNLYAPSYVECFNKGYVAGSDQNWECKADSLDKRVKFGEIKISCEGYDSINDVTFVLNGSCGLKYTLESTKTFKQYNEYYNKDLYETSKLSNFLTLIIMIVIISAIYKSCNKHRESEIRRDINGTFAHVIDSNNQEPSLNTNGLFPPPPPPYGLVTSVGNNANSHLEMQPASGNNLLTNNHQNLAQSFGSAIIKPDQLSNNNNNNNNANNANLSAPVNWGPFLANTTTSPVLGTTFANRLSTNRRSESPPPSYQERNGENHIPTDLNATTASRR